MTTVFIVDDHGVVVEGICSLLQGENDVNVIGFANTGKDCLQFLSQKQPDVLLVDISLPDVNGTDLCKMVTELYPRVFILALSTFNQGSYVRRMMENGANGYLLKNSGRDEIIEAIRLVAKGQTYLTFDAAQALKADDQRNSSLPMLTKREKEVLAFIAEGLTSAQISARLFISVDTVDSHRKNLHTKLNVKNTAMLIRFAIENGLI